MVKYKKRVRNLYDESSKEFSVSRSKIDRFIDCPRCFYLDRKLGLDRPSMPGWSLNTAVDHLLKKEFDIYREKQEMHPLMIQFGVNAIPFQHKDLPTWRDDVHRYIGASVIDENTGLKVQGIVDDIWMAPAGELIIVDYKATSTASAISLEDEYKSGYKRQMEIYQWIFRKMGFPVSSLGYFVFANALKDKEGFHGKLEFDLSLIPYIGDDSWVGPVIIDIKRVLDDDNLPVSGEDCEFCEYRKLIGALE